LDVRNRITGSADIGARGVQAPLAQKLAHPRLAHLVELVDGAQDGIAGYFGPRRLNCLSAIIAFWVWYDLRRLFQHAVQNLAVVHTHHIVATRNPHGLQSIRQERADLGIRRHARRANRIGVALVELPEPPRTGLLVAPHRPHRIAAIGRGQVVAVLSIDAGERCGQVIAQRHPLLVLVLPGKDALVRAVHVGQELAQRLDRLDARGLQRVEAIAMVDARDRVQHGAAVLDLGTEVITKAFGRFRLGPGLLFLFRHGTSHPA
jgi:hypothetical protein